MYLACKIWDGVIVRHHGSSLGTHFWCLVSFFIFWFLSMVYLHWDWSYMYSLECWSNVDSSRDAFSPLSGLLYIKILTLWLFGLYKYCHLRPQSHVNAAAFWDSLPTMPFDSQPSFIVCLWCMDISSSLPFPWGQLPFVGTNITSEALPGLSPHTGLWSPTLTCRSSYWSQYS